MPTCLTSVTQSLFWRLKMFFVGQSTKSGLSKLSFSEPMFRSTKLIVILFIFAKFSQIVTSGPIVSKQSRQDDQEAQKSSTIKYPPKDLEVMSFKAESSGRDPMKTAASHHHHKKTKGWLDMGAWTKKKGAFGWYADYPVGKG